jgi:hypothetical protein
LASVAGGASPGKEKISLNTADQAAARAAVLRRSDFGPGWSGGRTKPDLSAAPTCPNYHPKQSDLVLTGAAESLFHRPGMEVDSEVQVLRTARMVTLDWRSVIAPGALPCLRSLLAKGLGTDATVVSFRKLAFPKLTRYTAAFRAVVRVEVSGTAVRVLADAVLVGRRRSEITLNVAAPATVATALPAAERRLARKILARARA